MPKLRLIQETWESGRCFVFRELNGGLRVLEQPLEQKQCAALIQGFVIVAALWGLYA